MRPEFAPSLTRGEWIRIQEDLHIAARELAAAPEGIFRQPLYDRYLVRERRATEFINSWLASRFGLERVVNPKTVLSLDVDGVLEDERLGFSTTGIRGVAGLRLLQLGGVAVLLNTGRSIDESRNRAETFQLLGAVSAYGGVIWDGVFDREEILTSTRAQEQLSRLRAVLRSDPSTVVDSAHHVSLRVSRMVEGLPRPIVGNLALEILDRLKLDELTFWVAPRHTDFTDRGVDKAAGLERLRALMGIRSLPLAAMGDAECDIPVLRLAQDAIVPAATLPSYRPSQGQNLLRARNLGDASVWEAALQLVPDAALQRQVIDQGEYARIPEWLPTELRAASV